MHCVATVILRKQLNFKSVVIRSNRSSCYIKRRHYIFWDWTYWSILKWERRVSRLVSCCFMFPLKATFSLIPKIGFLTASCKYIVNERNERYRNVTELSKHVWNLKDHKINYEIKWRKVKQAKSYSNINKKCNFCLWEKFFIICKPEMQH